MPVCSMIHELFYSEYKHCLTLFVYYKKNDVAHFLPSQFERM